MNKFFSKQSLQILVTFGLWAFFLTWYFLVILWNVLHLYVFPDLYIPQVVSAFTKHVGLTIFIFLASFSLDMESIFIINENMKRS